MRSCDVQCKFVYVRVGMYERSCTCKYVCDVWLGFVVDGFCRGMSRGTRVKSATRHLIDLRDTQVHVNKSQFVAIKCASFPRCNIEKINAF